MKCSCCEWPTPAFRRDLFSGRCDVCQTLARRSGGVGVRHLQQVAQLRRAADELDRDVPPEQVAARLVELGHRRGDAELLVSEWRREQARAVQQVRERYGLTDDTPAAEVERHVKRIEARRVRRFGLLTLPVGLVLLAVGVGLYFVFNANARGWGIRIAASLIAFGGLVALVSLFQVMTGRAEFARFVFRRFGSRWD